MNKWVKTSDGSIESYINTAAIVSIEYHKSEGYMRICVSDGKTVIWRPNSDDNRLEMDKFYASFLDETKN